MKNEKGFIQVIVTLVVILAVLGLLGFDYLGIWENIFEPVFRFLGDLIVVLAKFLISVVLWAWNYLISIFN